MRVMYVKVNPPDEVPFEHALWHRGIEYGEADFRLRLGCSVYRVTADDSQAQFIRSLDGVSSVSEDDPRKGIPGDDAEDNHICCGGCTHEDD